MSIAVAIRYARALADVVGRTGDYRPAVQELQDFAAVYRESADLREVFETPAIPLPEKTKVLNAILEKLGTSATTRNFLRVLEANYRMTLLGEVIETFRRIVNDRLGIAQVKIFTASDLSEDERESLRARFVELTRKQVELEFHRQPELIGGILAQIGSTMYDGTVRGHLDRLRLRLTAG